jgi:methionyl-tRNA formyltransferase
VLKNKYPIDQGISHSNCWKKNLEMNNFDTVELTTPTIMRPNNTNANGRKKLRVVTFNYLPSAYKFVTDWIHENGHEHVLAVTSPGIKTRATPAYKDVLPMIPGHVSTIVTSRMNSVLAPILPHFKPDIILCFTFAHQVAQDICQIPTYGAVNIHPSVLPYYRGPNPLRQFYEGAEVFGVTAHRMANGYDTGEMLSQEYEPLPEIVTQDTAVRWGQLIKNCIASGMESAISGKPGIIQDDSQATYAAPFKEEEKWIDLTEPTNVIMRKTLGLNLAGGLAKTIINGQIYKIHSAHYISNATRLAAGSVIKQGVSMHEVATADGTVQLVTELYDANKKYCNVLPRSMFFGQQIGNELLNLS